MLSSTYAINDSLYFPLMCEYRLSETFEVVKTKPKCFNNYYSIIVKLYVGEFD